MRNRPRLTGPVSQTPTGRRPCSAPCVERQVQLEHVDAGLTQHAELPVPGVGVDGRENLGDVQPSGRRNTTSLKPGVGNGDLRVEPRTRRGDRVDRDDRIGAQAVLGAVGGGTLCHRGE